MAGAASAAAAAAAASPAAIGLLGEWACHQEAGSSNVDHHNYICSYITLFTT